MAAQKAKAKRAPKTVSIRGLARELNVTHRAVQLAIEDERIAAAVVERPRSKGHAWKIDLAKARKLWEKNTALTYRPEEEMAARGLSSLPEGAPSPEVSIELEPIEDELEFKSDSGLNKARAQKAQAEARLKGLEVLEREGKLMSRAAAEDVFMRIATVVQENVMNIGPECSGDLAVMEDVDEIERFLHLKLEKILTEAARAVESLGTAS